MRCRAVWLVQAVVIGSLALASNACARPGAATVIPAGGTEHVLTIGYVGSMQSLNPLDLLSTEQQNIGNFVWQGLLGEDDLGSPIPVLANAIPTVANGLIGAGGRSLTFQLRRNLRWSDGTPITGQDVRFGWHVAINRLADLCPQTCWDIRDVVVQNHRRVTFELRQPFSPLLFKMPPILPKHFLWAGSLTATVKQMYNPRTSFLTGQFPVDGPFEAVGLDSGHDTLTLRRNPYWTILARPGYSEVDFEGFDNNQDLLRAQLSDPDMQISQNYSMTGAGRGLTPLADGLTPVIVPDEGIEHLEPNIPGRCQQYSGSRVGLPLPSCEVHRGTAVLPGVITRPLENMKVRQALSLAIDRLSLVRQITGFGPSRAAQLEGFTPEMPGRFDRIAVRGVWDPIQQRWVMTPEVADADRLLSEAGWNYRSPTDPYRYRNATCVASAPGCQLQLLLLADKDDGLRATEAAALTDAWERIGVHLVVDQNHFATGNLIGPYGENGQCSRGYDDFCLFAELPGSDPITDFDLGFSSTHSARYVVHHGGTPNRADVNFTGEDDTRLDSIFREATRSYDLGADRSLLDRWQNVTARENYWIPLYQRPYIALVRGDVDGFAPSSRSAEWDPWALRTGPTRAPQG
jgi:ABC-type transport system substrate-binding protein